MKIGDVVFPTPARVLSSNGAITIQGPRIVLEVEVTSPAGETVRGFLALPLDDARSLVSDIPNHIRAITPGHN
jgi:hypothetical protein